jgi:hypothetical protein
MKKSQTVDAYFSALPEKSLVEVHSRTQTRNGGEAASYSSNLTGVG